MILVLMLLSLSSYLRLDESGIGCEPWPQCYGHVGEVAQNDVQQPVRDTFERLSADAQQPLSWATPWHRLVASILGVLILVLTGLAVLRRRDRVVTVALLALTVFLAWLGIYSEGLQSPAIVMGNISGGFLMLALLGWMVMRRAPTSGVPGQRTTVFATYALTAMAVQILLGGLTSANFAATACPELPTCQGRFMPDPAVNGAFDLGRTHTLSEQGFVVIPAAERAGIHQLHRLTGVVTFCLVVLAAVNAVRGQRGQAIAGSILLAVVTLEFAVGVAAVVTDLPIVLAVAHNWLAAITLLLLLALLAEGRSHKTVTIDNAGAQ